MKILRALFIAFLSFAFFACSGEDKKKGSNEKDEGKNAKKIEKLQKEVMKVHDEVMPKMEELQKLKQRAGRMADSLEKSGDSAVAARMDKTEARLEEGHESMMSWMRQYQEPADTLKASDAIHYLEGQKKKVRAMRDTMMGL